MKSCWIPSRSGFTVVELLVATTIFTVLMLVSIQVLGQVTTVWRRTSSSAEAFQSARLGFNLLTTWLGQATLRPYLEYDDASNPTRYYRKSDLQFVCLTAGAGSYPGTRNTGTTVFFQVPGGYTEQSANYALGAGGLNACGFYVEFGSDESWLPSFVSDRKYRYRLMQLLVPVEKNTIYQNTGLTSFSWFTDFIDPSQAAKYYARPVAENVIALIVHPSDPGDGTQFSSSMEYNSRQSAQSVPQPKTANQLPPVMNLTLVAIDEVSAKRLTTDSAEPSAISTALSGKFTNPSVLTQDLDNLAAALTAAKVNFRFFSTSVPMKESKWTK